MPLENNRVDELIRILQLQPHPEGGYFHEVYRSDKKVLLLPGMQERSSITTIYFLLVSGSYSTWHRIAEDEIWHFYEGAPLELLWAGPGISGHVILGLVSEARQQVAVVPPGCWQAARTMGEYTLVGCSVGPGFEFSSFEMLAAGSNAESELREAHPVSWNVVANWQDLSGVPVINNQI